MDRSEVKALADREAGPLMRRLGIGHWDVTIRYEPIKADGDWVRRGEARVNPDYDLALVTLNPEAFDDGGDAMKTLRHELLHVVLSPYDVFWEAVRPALERNPAALKVAECLWTHAAEKAVINLERMYRGLTEPCESPSAESSAS